MKNLLSIVLFLLSLSCFSQSLSPYFTRTRTLQLEGYSSTGVNIAYSYSAGSVNSWTINDTLADQWVNKRINDLLGGANFWPTSGNFSTNGNQTATMGGSLVFNNSAAGGFFTVTGSNTINFNTTGTGLFTTGNQLLTSNGGVFTLQKNNNGNLNILKDGTAGSIRLIKSGPGSDSIKLQHQNGTIALLSSGSSGNILLSSGGDGNINITSTNSLANVVMNHSGIITDSTIVNYGRMRNYAAANFWPTDADFSTNKAQQTITVPDLGFQSYLDFDVRASTFSIQNYDLNNFGLHMYSDTDWGTAAGLVTLHGTTTQIIGGTDFSPVNRLNITNSGNSTFQSSLSLPLRYLDDYTPNMTNNNDIPSLLRVRQVVSDSLAGFSGGGVTSFEGRTGAVVAQSGDYLASEVTNAFDKSADDAGDVSYTPATTGDWPNSDPSTVQAGLDTLAKWSKGIAKDTVNIGVWDMDATDNISVSFPSGVNLSNIISYQVWIYDDDGTQKNPIDLSTVPAWAICGTTRTSSTGFDLFRQSGLCFDSTEFNDNTINRGHIIYFYIP